jgi:hypothetical protein
VSLQALRERVKADAGPTGRLKVGVITGDVRQMHHALENHSALFRVASQINLLEMVSPTVTPEDGVTRYQYDRTRVQRAQSLTVQTIYRKKHGPTMTKILLAGVSLVAVHENTRTRSPLRRGGRWIDSRRA